MVIVFAEYRIEPTERQTYLKAIGELMEEYRTSADRTATVRLLEGEEQENLFVEIWEAPTIEQARCLKDQRLTSIAWSELERYIKGGRERLHVWVFAPVTPS